MTALDDPEEYTQYDAEFLALLANLDLRDVPSTPSSSPGQPARGTLPASPFGRGHASSHRTQPPQTPQTSTLRCTAVAPCTPSGLEPPPYSVGPHTFPTARSRTYQPSSPTLYHFESPTGADTQWNGHLQAALLKVYTTVMHMLSSEVLASRESKKRHTSFSVCHPCPSATLPEDLSTNPLHETEALNDWWYMVYCGIHPGVYRSHLECQLNTLGVHGTLHESVIGRACAFSKYAKAESTGLVKVVAPMYYPDAHDADPFL
ncbi:hypothetical protein B0H13DRAFT_1890745 [Mycena leptocephala]|nr:hypothetical protein B0H13DRAFT_1890745 [Mycena leptocephala]